MCKCKSKKGFTLAELLVVVAIIAVLVAIAIPVFGASQKKAKLAVDHAAIRDAYAIVQIANNLGEVEIDGVTYSFAELERVKGYYVLSKDCSSLLPLTKWSDAYRLQESGTGDDDTACPDCTIWDDMSDGAYYNPISKQHTKDLFVYVSFDKSSHKLVLGVLH